MRENNQEELGEIDRKMIELKNTLKQLEERRREVEIHGKEHDEQAYKSHEKQKRKEENINAKYRITAHEFLDPRGPFPTLSLAKDEIKPEGLEMHGSSENSDRVLS